MTEEQKKAVIALNKATNISEDDKLLIMDFIFKSPSIEYIPYTPITTPVPVIQPYYTNDKTWLPPFQVTCKKED